FADARAIADAVLYEGYLLYPYRASATKNRMRWQFGVLAPTGADTGDPSSQQTELLLEATDDAELAVCVRFLRLTTRNEGVDGTDGWDEGDAVEHEIVCRVADVLAGEVVDDLGLARDDRSSDGDSFTSLPIRARVSLAAERLPGP